MQRPISESPYEQPEKLSDIYMREQGIPVYEALYGIEDITELPRKPWARMGGKGTFVELEPTRQQGKMLYVAEIPPGKALEPEHHLYDETFYILQGRGLAEVWQGKEAKRSFEWGAGSLFCMPLNVSHRLVNGGREPVLFFVQTNAPVVMEAMHDIDFVFSCDYKFTSRYSGKADFFNAGEKREKDPTGQNLRLNLWYTNFVPDLNTAVLDDAFEKVSGGQLTRFIMSGGFGGHSSAWPPGRYHSCHFHIGGAIILGMKGEGFVLLWHRRYGIHPFKDGHGDKVIKLPWRKNSIYSPGNAIFHGHYNTSTEYCRQLRWVGGGDRFSWPMSRAEERRWVERSMHPTAARSFREGGSQILYDDEDPEVRRMFEAELKKKKIKSTMPPVVYRTDPYKLPWEGQDEGGLSPE